jgi:uncharacterized phage protein (predicted DNA packaging)
MTLEERKEELKGYLRIDHDYEDNLLEALLHAGYEYMANAGIPKGDSYLYRLAVMLYVSIHYENRDGTKNMPGLSYALQSIIIQQQVSNLGNGVS